MPDVKLYINNQLCDLVGDESIEVDYTIFDITKIGSRGGARSYEFNLPKTNRNKQIFENPEIVNNLSAMPYDSIEAMIYVDGIDMKIRFAQIESAGQTYGIRVYGANTTLFDKLGKLKLIDIDWSVFDQYWNIANIIASRTNRTGIIYPIADYHSDSPNSFINNDNGTIDVEHVPPAIHVKSILDKIFEFIGYTYTNEVEDDAELVIPLIHGSSNDVLNDFLNNKYKGTFGMNSGVTLLPQILFGQFVGYRFAFDTVIGNTSGYYSLPYTIRNGRLAGSRCLRFVDAFTATITVSFDITFSSTVNSVIFVPLFIDGSGAEVMLANSLNLIFSGYSIGTHNITFEIPYSPPLNQSNSEYNLIIEVYNGPNTSSSFYIENTSTIQLSNINLYGNYLEYGKYITVGLFLPDLSLLDFIKNYMQWFCLFPVISEESKTVQLKRFDTIKSNLSLAYQWGDKLDLNFEQESKYIIESYGQNNFCKFQQDGEEIVPVGSDGSILIKNKNLTLEKVLIESDFASCNFQTRLEDNIVSQIPIYTEGEISLDLEPRILYIQRKTEAEMGTNIIYSITGFQYPIATDIPMGYFINPQNAWNLGFGNSLIPNYYQFIGGIMQRVKITAVYVRLSASDISQLDFSRPVFIRQLESYFYISAVKGFSYTESKSTLVELVKLNING